MSGEGCGERDDNGYSCALWLGQTERSRQKMPEYWVGQGTRQLAKGPIEATKIKALLRVNGIRWWCDLGNFRFRWL